MPEKTHTVTFTSKTPGNHPMRLEVGEHTLVEGEAYEGLTEEEVDRIKEDFGGKDGPLRFKVDDASSTASKPKSTTTASQPGSGSTPDPTGGGTPA